MFNLISNLLVADSNKTYGPFLTEGFPIIRIILVSLMAVCALTLIVAVLLQQNADANGINAISGEQESYYNSNRNLNKEGRLKKITIICSSIIFALILLFFITYLIYPA